MAKAKKLNKAAQEVSTVRRARHSGLLTVIFTIISLIWIYPLVVVTLNSFKKKAFIFKNPFGISRYSLFGDGAEKWEKGIKQVFFGIRNYVNAWNKTGFPRAFGFSLFITVFRHRDHSLHIHGCMVHRACEVEVHLPVLHPVPVLDDCPVPDGYVHAFQVREHPSSR